jgi:hypothetical protein
VLVTAQAVAAAARAPIATASSAILRTVSPSSSVDE